MSSLKDVAEACGVSKGTVSVALRGIGDVAPATRARILEAAKRLKYRPDTVAARLSGRKKRQRGSARGLPIVAVSLATTKRSSVLEAMVEHAERLGYLCRLATPPPTKEAWVLQLRRWYRQGVGGIVLHRPIQALSLPPEHEEWRHFAIAGCFLDPGTVPCHSVGVDVVDAVCTCWRELYGKGYRRIGLALCRHDPEIEDDRRRWAAALLMQTRQPARAPRLPVFRESLSDPHMPQRFLRWFEQHRPDAVVGFTAAMAWWLRDAGWKVPGDVAIATLHCGEAEWLCSGYDLLHRETGEKSIELLDELIRRNETGWPQRPRRVVLTSGWTECKSTPPRNSGAAVHEVAIPT